MRNKSKDQNEGQAREVELFQQIGQQQMELAHKNLISSDARELSKLVDHDHPKLNISRQSALLSQSRSTLYSRLIPVRESTLWMGLQGNLPENRTTLPGDPSKSSACLV